MHGSSVPYQVAEGPLGGLREDFQYELDEVRVVVVEPQQLHQVRHRRGEEPAKDLEGKAVIHLSCLLWLKVQVFPVINFNLSHPKIEPIRGILAIEPLTGVTDVAGVWDHDFDIISICI